MRIAREDGAIKMLLHFEVAGLEDEWIVHDSSRLVWGVLPHRNSRHKRQQ